MQLKQADIIKAIDRRIALAKAKAGHYKSLGDKHLEYYHNGKEFSLNELRLFITCK